MVPLAFLYFWDYILYKRQNNRMKQMENAMENRWMSVEEAATYLGVKRDTIYRWIKNKGLPTYKVGRLWKFKSDDLDAWVKVGNTAESLD